MLWRREIVRQRAAPIYKGNDPASPTPTSDGSNVYVFFPDLGLVSSMAGGNERWRVPLGPFHSFYAMESSPVVSGDVVVQQCDQQSKSFVIAGTGIRVRFAGESSVRTCSKALQRPLSGSRRTDRNRYSSSDFTAWMLTRSSPVRAVGGWNPRYMPKGVPVIGPDMIYVSAPGGEPMGPPSWEVALKDVDKNADGRVQREEVRNIPEAYGHFGWTDLNGDGAMDRDEFQRFNTMGLGGHGLHALKPGGAGDRTRNSIRWHKIPQDLPQHPRPVAVPRSACTP